VEERGGSAGVPVASGGRHTIGAPGVPARRAERSARVGARSPAPAVVASGFDGAPGGCSRAMGLGRPPWVASRGVLDAKGHVVRTPRGETRFGPGGEVGERHRQSGDGGKRPADSAPLLHAMRSTRGRAEQGTCRPPTTSGRGLRPGSRPVVAAFGSKVPLPQAVPIGSEAEPPGPVRAEGGGPFRGNTGSRAGNYSGRVAAGRTSAATRPVRLARRRPSRASRPVPTPSGRRSDR